MSSHYTPMEQVDAEPPYAGVEPAWAKPRRTRRRFRFLAIFLVVGCALGTLMIHRSTSGSALKTHNRPHTPTAAPSVLPPDVIVRDCGEWGPKNSSWWNSAASLSFGFPLNTNDLFFLTEGAAINGVFNVFAVPESDEHELGNGYLEFSISSRYESFIDQTQICHATRPNGDGIAIKVGYPPSWFDNTQIGITLRIPVSEKVIKFNNFETDLPYIRQVLYTPSSITFGSLKLRGQGQDVDAGLVIADSVDLRTSDAMVGGVFHATGPISLFTTNGMVSGQFNSSTSVSLITSNAPISAKVHLANDESTGKDTELIMQTTNGPINGNVTLTSLADNGLGGWFDVSAVTSNGASNLNFPSISPRAKLDLISHTTSNSANVELASTYEGDWTIDTTSGSKAEFRTLNSQDPENRGRKRVGMGTGSKSDGHGRVWWDEDGQDNGKGTVEVKTTYGSVTLVM
ncbi:hypothetical protein BDN72DRAFT_824806 [Pluteus cervinus]|uniref:Uncharacterized protein n=1 Tax=Pluteus cervinus TaxID=181527 RepID=A0ACD3AIB9_9AGAR|nr:hypothetical protein BDN72DRAFT_824806 [Pluteus cervinus]